MTDTDRFIVGLSPSLMIKRVEHPSAFIYDRQEDKVYCRRVFSPITHEEQIIGYRESLKGLCALLNGLSEEVEDQKNNIRELEKRIDGLKFVIRFQEKEIDSLDALLVAKGE